MDLKKIEKELQARRMELAGRADHIEQDITRANTPLDQDWEEASVQRENDQVLDALDDNVRAEIFQIDRALGRIREGKYSVCEKCGSAIGEARLQALPYATACVNCA